MHFDGSEFDRERSPGEKGSQRYSGEVPGSLITTYSHRNYPDPMRTTLIASQDQSLT
jgi:hypothetical protein